MFLALILLSPLTVMLPIINSTSVGQATYVTSEQTTQTYTSMTFNVSFKSTTGTATIQTPTSLPSKGIGFMAPKGKCSQYTLPVTVKSGTTLNLELTSTNPANLYLLPTYTFQTSPDGCNLIGSALLTEKNFTAYTFHWTAAEDGTIYLLLTGPTTIIILTDHGSTEPVKQLATITYASTETNFNLYSTTNFVTYTRTTTNPVGSLLYAPQVGYGVGIVGFLVSLLGAMLILASKKQKK